MANVIIEIECPESRAHEIAEGIVHTLSEGWGERHAPWIPGAALDGCESFRIKADSGAGLYVVGKVKVI